MTEPGAPTFEELMMWGNGCMFCGLRYPKIEVNGKPGHVIDRNGGVAYCVRDNQWTPKRPQ